MMIYMKLQTILVVPLWPARPEPVAHTLRHMPCSKSADHEWSSLQTQLNWQWLSGLPAAVLHDQDELIRCFAGSQQLQDIGVVWQV